MSSSPWPKITPEEEAELWRKVASLGGSIVSRKKQAVPNDPISETKQKMLERKARRMQAEAPVPPPLTPFTNPDTGLPIPLFSPAPGSSLAEDAEKLTEKLKAAWEEEQKRPEYSHEQLNKMMREYWKGVEREARTLVGDAAVDAEYSKEHAEAETWKRKDPIKKRIEAKVKKLEKMHRGIATPTYPVPDHLPVVIMQEDRPSTPKDALGPTPGIVRQLVLGTAEWPRHISVAKSFLLPYEQRHVRYHREQGRLYFWLENGSAVYDVAETPDGLWLEGDLLCGVVYPLTPTTPKEE